MTENQPLPITMRTTLSRGQRRAIESAALVSEGTLTVAEMHGLSWVWMVEHTMPGTGLRVWIVQQTDVSDKGAPEMSAMRIRPENVGRVTAVNAALRWTVASDDVQEVA